ncbi:MAG: hypothetical protein HQK79_08310 [Desulfobacterales bacterium]|nr:hypothetical protein [Desulfobacterales bacterium]
MNEEEILNLALYQLEILIQNNPEKVKYQKEIERLMDGAVTFENRMAVLQLMMEANLIELQQEMQNFVVLLKEMYDSFSILKNG